MGKLIIWMEHRDSKQCLKLRHQIGGASPQLLAADLIPPRGVKALQSDNVRELARKAFRGPRSR